MTNCACSVSSVNVGSQEYYEPMKCEIFYLQLLQKIDNIIFELMILNLYAVLKLPILNPCLPSYKILQNIMKANLITDKCISYIVKSGKKLNVFFTIVLLCC